MKHSLHIKDTSMSSNFLYNTFFFSIWFALFGLVSFVYAENDIVWVEAHHYENFNFGNGTNIVSSGNDAIIYVVQSPSFASYDSAQTWGSLTLGSTPFFANNYSMAMSSDGTTLASVGSNSVLVSNNGGVTWTWHTPDNNSSTSWSSVAISGDGTRIAAVSQGGTGRLYMSSDGGTTWVQSSAVSLSGWQSVSMSNDGTYLVAAPAHDVIRTSSDSGSAWTTRDSSGTHAWDEVAISADGQRIVALPWIGPIFVSGDNGATWTQSSASNPWTSVSMSDNGLVIAVGTYAGTVYFSQDGGSTWEEESLPTVYPVYDVLVSSDGSRVYAAAEKSVYVSVHEPTCTVTLTPNSISTGGNSTLSYSSENAAWMSIANVGYIPANTSGSFVLAPTETTDYTCTVADDFANQYTSVASLSVTNVSPHNPTIIGPTTGAHNTTHTFSISTTDPEGDFIRYEIDWDNDQTVDEERVAGVFIASGSEESLSNDWAGPGSKTFNVRALDENGNYSNWTSHTIVLSNTAPVAPTINGPSTGSPAVSNLFTFSATDPDSDTIRYEIDWDNSGSVDETVPISGYIASGTQGSATHTWNSAATYTIAIRTSDVYGGVSVWSTHTIDIQNSPPTIPTVSGSCIIGENSTFYFQSTDPEGENLYYDYDWSDTEPDGRVPASGYVASGTQQSVMRMCTDSTPITLLVRAIDESGNPSVSWQEYPFTPISPCGHCVYDGGSPQGLLTTSLSLVQPGQTVTVSWDLENVTNCSVSGTNTDTWDWETVRIYDSRTSSPIIGETQYTLTCDNLSGGSVTDTTTVYMVPLWQEF